MSNTREIVSLQFGHYSNFIGSHFWNLQESSFDYSGSSVAEVNHDILYREGHTSRREVTYTPRLLLADLAGSLNHLSVQGGLYETPVETDQPVSTWSETDVEVIKEPQIEKNAYQKSLDEPPGETRPDFDFERDVKVWSDFLYTRFHPRTVNVVHEYQHENQEVPFETFPAGVTIWKTLHFQDEFCDKIRAYAEECDSLQGFHVTMDCVDGFGGLANGCLQYIKDEYESKAILAFPVIPSTYPDYRFTNANEREKSSLKDSVRLINLALCARGLAEHSSLFIPLCTGSRGWRKPGDPRNFKHIQYNADMPYHTSALLATAIDTFTLRYRKKPLLNSYVSDMCADLNGLGRKAAAASMGFPFGIKENEDLIDCLDKWEGPLWESITPNCKIDKDRAMQIITLRGIPESRLKRPPQDAKMQREMPAYKCSSVHEMLSFYLSCTSYATASNVVTVTKPLNIKVPYPKIFASDVTSNGFISIRNRLEEQNVTSAPIIAGLHTGSGIGDMLETLHREVSRLKIRRFNQFTSAGLEFDEYNEMLSEIGDLRECYEDSYE